MHNRSKVRFLRSSVEKTAAILSILSIIGITQAAQIVPLDKPIVSTLDVSTAPAPSLQYVGAEAIKKVELSEIIRGAGPGLSLGEYFGAVDAEGRGIAVADNGTIYVTGWIVEAKQQRFMILEYLSDGTLNNAFSYDIDAYVTYEGNRITINRDNGQLTVAGRAKLAGREDWDGFAITVELDGTPAGARLLATSADDSLNDVKWHAGSQHLFLCGVINGGTASERLAGFRFVGLTQDPLWGYTYTLFPSACNGLAVSNSERVYYAGRLDHNSDGVFGAFGLSVNGNGLPDNKSCTLFLASRMESGMLATSVDATGAAVYVGFDGEKKAALGLAARFAGSCQQEYAFGFLDYEVFTDVVQTEDGTVSYLSGTIFPDVTARDAAVLSLTSKGAQLNEFRITGSDLTDDTGKGIARDSEGKTYITGKTASRDLPFDGAYKVPTGYVARIEGL